MEAVVIGALIGLGILAGMFHKDQFLQKRASRKVLREVAAQLDGSYPRPHNQSLASAVSLKILDLTTYVLHGANWLNGRTLVVDSRIQLNFSSTGLSDDFVEHFMQGEASSYIGALFEVTTIERGEIEIRFGGHGDGTSDRTRRSAPRPRSR